MGKVFIGSQDNFEWVGVFFHFDGGKSIWGESTKKIELCTCSCVFSIQQDDVVA